MTTSGLRAVRLATLFLAYSSPAFAQLVPVKTVPIAQGDQLQIFPSHRLGMGSVSIALPDSLQDPFVNPATGARIAATRFVSAPTVYSLSRDAGGGRSLPLAALARAGAWYGALLVALQQVDPSRPPGSDGVFFPAPPPSLLDTVAPIPGPDLRPRSNQYVFGMLGKVLEGPQLSLGASVLWTGLGALDGIDLLYAGSRRVAPSGHALDLRLGLLKDWTGGRSLEGVLLHNRSAVRHDVTFVDRIWDPGLARVVEQARPERYADRAHTWGLHLKYAIPLGTDGWRIGWLATANRATHPSIPSYAPTAFPGIPRDLGGSSAYNLGVGLSRARGPATFGFDVVYEPIWSHTWTNALGSRTTGAGGETLENRFQFSNVVFRIGTSRDVDLLALGKAAGLQLGLVLRSIGYRLVQTDHVQGVGGSMQTRWLEWTPTWGLSLRFPELEFRYRGRVTHGAGRPGFFQGGVRLAALDVLPPPIGSVGTFPLTDVSTVTHQISLSLPLR